MLEVFATRSAVTVVDAVLLCQPSWQNRSRVADDTARELRRVPLAMM